MSQPLTTASRHSFGLIQCLGPPSLLQGGLEEEERCVKVFLKPISIPLPPIMREVKWISEMGRHSPEKVPPDWASSCSRGAGSHSVPCCW